MTRQGRSARPLLHLVRQKINSRGVLSILPVRATAEWSATVRCVQIRLKRSTSDPFEPVANGGLQER